MFLLDTNVISEIRRASKADPNVMSWIGGQAATNLYLSAVTILELEIGALRLARKDRQQADRLLSWIETGVVPQFLDRILPIDHIVARRCVPLHVPDRRNDRDAYIAASALVHGLAVATRNVKDFAGTGVSVFNPWTGATTAS